MVVVVYYYIFCSMQNFTYCHFAISCDVVTGHSPKVAIYHISRPITHTVISSLQILEKNNDECIFILLIYWKKTGLLHTKIGNHNIIYSS